MYSSGNTRSQALEFVRANAKTINSVGNEDVGANYWLRMICMQNHWILRLLADIASDIETNSSILATLHEVLGALRTLDDDVALLGEQIVKP